MRRRALFGFAAVAGASCAAAQTIIPDEAIDVLVGFQSAGGPDAIARRIAGALERRLGRHVDVENRPGGGGARPGELLKRQSPDGTTFALFASPTFVARLTDPNFGFDPIKDLAPISLIGVWPVALAVSLKIGVSSFEAYRRWLEVDDPARRKIGIPAPFAFFDTFDRLFSQHIGIPIQSVPSPGGGALASDLAAGRLPAVVAGLGALLEHHRGGRLKILATTALRRLPSAPDIPTAQELGVAGTETVEWYGFFARAGTPRPLIDEWNRQITAVLKDPLVAGDLDHMGLEVMTSTPEELGARLQNHLETWKARLTAVGIKLVQ